MLENKRLIFNDGLPYFDHLLRECWSFRQRPKGNGKTGVFLTVRGDNYHGDNP